MKPRTLIHAKAIDTIEAGQDVQVLVDPDTGRATVRLATLVCSWCPDYAYPDPACHPGGQQAHVAGTT